MSPLAAPVQVERFHVLAANPPPTPFVITALTRGQTADPVFQVASNVVGGLLEREGHPRLSLEQAYSAPWKVTLETVIAPRPGAPGTVTSGPVPMEKRLTVTIRDNGRTVYQGRAILVDGSQDLTGSVVELARALFREFPGPQGVATKPPLR